MKDEFIMKKVTPYARLRKWKGWAQIDVAEEVGVSRKSLSSYETGRRDPPKRVVVALDEFYKCKGELIQYWLSAKFSFGYKKSALSAIKTALRKITNLFSL